MLYAINKLESVESKSWLIIFQRHFFNEIENLLICGYSLENFHVMRKVLNDCIQIQETNKVNRHLTPSVSKNHPGYPYIQSFESLLNLLKFFN